MAMVLVALTGLLVLSGCGSSSSSSSAQSTSSSEEKSSETGSATTAKAEESNGSNLEHSYAPGVRTLAELYEGDEGPVPASGPPAKKGVKTEYISCGQVSPACASVAAGFNEAAKAMGWENQIIDGNFNINEGYSKAIRTAIAAKPDMIVMTGLDCSEFKGPFEEAKAAGIPLAAEGSLDCSDPAEGETASLFSVEQNSSSEVANNRDDLEQQGERIAQYVIDKAEGKAKAIVLEEQVPLGEVIYEAEKRTLEKCSECEIVATVPWVAADQVPNGPLFQKFNAVFVQHPEANAVIAVFDGNLTSAGIAKAIVDAGRAKETISVSIGSGDPETLELIEDEKGVSAQPAAFDPNRRSWGLADLVNRFLSGEPSVPEGAGYTAIDLEHNLPPKGERFETSIPFRKDYLKIWEGK